MNQLLQLNRLLSIRRNDFTERNVHGASSSSDETIRMCACAQSQHRFIAALVIGNEHLLLRMASREKEKAVVRRIPWFYQTAKKISAICFDPSGSWLLCATRDATLYLIPALRILDSSASFHDPPWPLDDVTTVKLPIKRSTQPTAVVWWLNANNENIVIIGNEMGEISFINMNLQMEVGGTYITVSVSDMSLVHDSDSTFVLISGANGLQWTLLLSQKSSQFLWPLERNDASARQSAPRRSLSDSIFGNSSSDVSKNAQVDSHPQRLARFAGHTRLDVHKQLLKNIISGYFVPTSVLSVHTTDLSVVPVVTYKLPPACGFVCLGDKLIFLTNKNHDRLMVMSVRLAETNIDGEKDLDPESVLQSFKFEEGEKVIRLFGCVDRSTDSRLRSSSEGVAEKMTKLDLGSSHGTQSPKIGSRQRVLRNTKCHDWDTIPIGDLAEYDSCVVVTNFAIYECRLRMIPERIFLQLVLDDVDVRRAERLAFIFTLATNLLYEKAALCKLSRGQVAPAVRFFQMAKCSHTKCVANFAAHGFLSELIGYVRALFGTQSSNDFSTADRRRLSNLALHCYIQQILEVKIGTSNVKQSFKEFLRDNRHYDEALAVRLLANQGMYSILKYLSEIRGVVTEMMRELLGGSLRLPYVNDLVAILLAQKGLEQLMSLGNNGDFVECLAGAEIMPFLAPFPDLLYRHVAMMTGLVESWHDIGKLHALTCLYDPAGAGLRPFLKKALDPLQKRSHGNFPLNCWISDATCDDKQAGDDDRNGYRAALEFFIHLLIMLQVARGHGDGFDHRLMIDHIPSETQQDEPQLVHISQDEKRPLLPLKTVPLACGFNHAAVIRAGNIFTWGSSESGRTGTGTWLSECSGPTALRFFPDLGISVKSVACGNSHTIALTEIGVFAWGSSRYGQLGVGKVAKVAHPTYVGELADASVVAIGCGQYHSLAITEHGTLYTWGWGIHGQLGHGDPYNRQRPEMIRSLSEEVVVRASGGYGHTVVLTAKGEVFACGCSAFGQLGLGGINKSSVPVQVVLPETVTFLTAGYFHSVAVTTSNKIYTWGCNPQVLRLQAQAVRRNRIQHLLHKSPSDPDSESTLRQLAESSNLLQSQAYLTPEEVEASAINSPVVHVACGSMHNVLLTSDGEVFSWGRSLEGQLGNGTRTEQKEPMMVVAVNDRRMIHVACGSDFTLAIDSDHEIWGWGRNDLGQLGTADELGACNKKQGSIQGKIITVKTNRRTIQIKKTWQSSVPKPQIIQINSPMSTQYIGNGFPDFYSSKRDEFETTCDLHPVDVFHSMNNVNDDGYSSTTLHLVLKIFHGFYDNRKVLRFCCRMGCLQAAAKVCLLDGCISESLHFQLAAVQRLGSGKLDATLAVGEFYIRRMNCEEHVASKAVLKQIVQFWMQNLLPLHALEDLLLPHLSELAHPHGLLLLGSDEVRDKDVDELHTKEATSKLSTKFCLALVSFILQRIDEGKPNGEYMELLAKLTELDWLQPHEGAGSDWSIATSSRRHTPEDLCADTSVDHLWDQIMHNVRQDASRHKTCIHLSPHDVDLLTQTSAADGSDSVLAFTCGHHFSANTFKHSVLPQWEAAMNDLPKTFPNTTRKLMCMFNKEGFLPSACPKCVLAAFADGSFRL